MNKFCGLQPNVKLFWLLQTSKKKKKSKNSKNLQRKIHTNILPISMTLKTGKNLCILLIAVIKFCCSTSSCPVHLRGLTSHHEVEARVNVQKLGTGLFIGWGDVWKIWASDNCANLRTYSNFMNLWMIQEIIFQLDAYVSKYTGNYCSRT